MATGRCTKAVIMTLHNYYNNKCNEKCNNTIITMLTFLFLLITYQHLQEFNISLKLFNRNLHFGNLLCHCVDLNVYISARLLQMHTYNRYSETQTYRHTHNTHTHIHTHAHTWSEEYEHLEHSLEGVEQCGHDDALY